MTGTVPEHAFVLKRARRRTIALHIDRQGGLEVRAPNWVSRRDILAFVNEKAAWIAAQRQKIAAAPAFEQAVFEDGGRFRLFGYLMAVSVDMERRRVVCEALVVDDHPASPASDHTPGCGLQLAFRGTPSPAAVQLVIRRAVRERLARFIEARLAYWRTHEAFSDLPALQVKLRMMRRRWGSCRRNGTLTFSETLAKYPMACIDAVIVHELCHLRHFNHGPAFYALMTQVLPDWRQADRWLDTEARRY